MVHSQSPRGFSLLEQKNESNLLWESRYFKFQSHRLDLMRFIIFDEKSKKDIVDGNIEFLTLDEFWESQLNQDFGY